MDRWRRHDEEHLGAEAVEEYVHAVFPGARVVAADQFRYPGHNTNLRLTLDKDPPPVVLRRYLGDPAACRREIAALRALPPVVLAPAVVHAEPDATPPWALFALLDGGPFDVAMGLVTRPEALMLAADAGATLAAIHSVGFDRPARLGPDLEPCEPLGTWSERSIGLADGAAAARLGERMTTRLGDYVARHAAEMDALSEPAVLCHGDYTTRNVLARVSDGVTKRSEHSTTQGWGFASSESLDEVADRPRLAGVVDWEDVVAGPPLADVGSFLRDDARLPAGFADAFAAGYRRLGGELPDGWRELARRLDLVRLCELAVGAPDGRERAHHRGLIEETIALG